MTTFPLACPISTADDLEDPVVAVALDQVSAELGDGRVACADELVPAARQASASALEIGDWIRNITQLD
jgi:hypothetical protein